MNEVTNESLLSTLSTVSKNSPDYNRLRTELIQRNLGLVTFVLKKRKVSNRTQFDDLKSNGMVSLLKAIDSYDPERGMFTTFATQCINNDITKYLQDESKHRGRNPVSFDPQYETPVSNESGKFLEASKELRRLFEENGAELSNVEREVISRRFGFTGNVETLEDIGISLSLTKERIRQISLQGVKKLRKAFVTQ